MNNTKTGSDYKSVETNSMAFTLTEFPGLIVFEPQVFGDDRGYFFESYNQTTFLKNQVHIQFVQDNQARSLYGVVRGLHYQKNPFAQTKLIRVLEGEIFDVVVDLRINSPSYGKVYGIELSAENKKQLLIPKGFAHGYSVLSKSAEVFYKCDDYYNKQQEGGLAYNDPSLNIDWKVPKEKMILSAKDLQYPSLKDCDHNFYFKENVQ